MTHSPLFLTGANGYVGRNLISHFTAKGVRVTGLVRNAKAAEQVAGLGAHPVIGDMLEVDLARLMVGATSLVHAAANLDHGPGRNAERQNSDGTRRVLEAARKAGIIVAVHLSTDSVLQNGAPLTCVDETAPYPRVPAGGYSRGKAKAEQIAHELASDSFRVVVLRPRFVWGRDDGTALPRLVDNVRSNRFAWISGGNYLSSTTHIGNLCHAVELALSRGMAGETYHISDGQARPFREIVTALLATQGLQPADKSIPRGVLKAMARIGDGLFWISSGRIRGPLSFQEYATSAVEITLDITKAERDLGYAPLVSWQEGLDELSQYRSGQSESR